MNEQQLVSKYLGEYKVKGSEIQIKYCPFCDGGQHHDQETFSINVDKHTFNCLRGKCGQRGTFKELCDRYDEKADYYTEWLKANGKEYYKQEKYVAPQYKTSELGTKTISYFNSRGISKTSLESTGVKTIINNGSEYAVFQFFDGEQHVMNKIRITWKQRMIKGKLESKEWKEKGGKHVLWNIKNIDITKPVVISEGMIDALSIIEAGYKNTVSIPSGTNDMTWIENSYEWINSVNQWILYVDNDDAGLKLSKELSIKFGGFKTKIVTHELKDANEELNILGKEYIMNCIKYAKIPKLEGITDISEVKIVDPTKMERCTTGIKGIDSYCGGYIFPSLNVWTGKRGCGKSTVVGQSILDCVQNGYNAFIYTGELSASYFKLWLYCQASGESNIYTEIDTRTGIENHKPIDKAINQIDLWLKNKVYIYDDNNTNEEEQILQMMDEAYKRYNCRVFLLDNLMTIKFKHNSDGIYRSQSEFIDILRGFSIRNNVIVNVVVHPNKQNEVGGSGDITNAAHNVFWVKRVESEENPALQGYDGYVEISKNRYYGEINVLSPYHYSKKSRRIYKHKESELDYVWDCPF